MELNENFSYTGAKQNFDRDNYATLAEMKAVKAKKMPSIFHATCEETGKLYIYRKTNTEDEILGRWREIGGSSNSIPTYDFKQNLGQQLSGDKFYQALAEEIIKHTDGVFFISATDYYSTNKYLVTYSPYYNYRQPNRWTAYYGNVVLTVSYSKQYRLSWTVHNIPSDAIVPYYIDSLPSYGDNGDTAILVKKYSYDYQQDDNGQTLYAWKAVNDDSIVYTEFQYEKSEVSDLFSFDSSTGKFEKLQNKKIKSIKDNTLTIYDIFDNTLEFTRSSDDDLAASKINETAPTAELYVCKTIPEVSSEWIKIGSGSENLFNNDGPELPIYSFTQGNKTSDEMFELIGNSYYAKYGGDYGRGNEPFIPGFGGRADRATVYVENAPMFGTSKCRLFATNSKGQVFEGFFVTTRATPTFTSDGLVWREIKTEGALTVGDVEYIVQANMPTAVVYSKEVYDSMSGEELYKFLETIYRNVYQKTNNFDNIATESLANNTKLEITEFTCVGHDELISPTVMDRITEYTLRIKDGTETKLIAARGNLSRKYTNTSVNSDSIKITAANPDFIETDTIDFTAWPEYTSPETNGIVLDGQGGANIDDSNVSVDPNDIEEED